MFFQQLKGALTASSQDFPRFLKKYWPLLLGLMVFCEGFQQYFISMHRVAQGSQTMLVAVTLGKLSVSLIEYVLLTMLIPFHLHPLPATREPLTFMQYNVYHMGPFTAESFRALASTIIWSLALILPGIYRYIQLFFVPYIVLADPAYQAGNRDALDHSKKLVEGATLGLFLILALITGLEFTREGARESFTNSYGMLAAIPLLALYFLSSIFINILLFRLYQLREKGLSERSGSLSGVQ